MNLLFSSFKRIFKLIMFSILLSLIAVNTIMYATFTAWKTKDVVRFTPLAYTGCNNYYYGFDQ